MSRQAEMFAAPGLEKVGVRSVPTRAMGAHRET
jgi:hypothetical protein